MIFQTPSLCPSQSNQCACGRASDSVCNQFPARRDRDNRRDLQIRSLSPRRLSPRPFRDSPSLLRPLPAPLSPIPGSLRPLGPASQARPGPLRARPAPSSPLRGSQSSPRPRPVHSASPLRCSRGFGCAWSRLHGDAACTATRFEPRANWEQGWPSVSALPRVGVRRPQAGSDSGASRLPRRRARSFGLEFCIPEIPRNYLDKTDAVKASKFRQIGRLLVFDPKERVTTEPNETMSDKFLFGRKPRLACKLYASPAPVSLNVAKTFSEKKEVYSKNIENKVSLKNTENRVSSKSIENKDKETNLQSKLWSSSFLKESTGGVGKDALIAGQEKNNKYCLQDNDKLSESTDDDGEDDTNDEDSNPNKDTHAPLELMAEFLRAEMSQDYHLAKKLCQMILIYEPENPEAKEFFSLIEEMLLMEKAQNLEEDDDDSSSESEGESSEGLSEESSDECEDG